MALLPDGYYLLEAQRAREPKCERCGLPLPDCHCPPVCRGCGCTEADACLVQVGHHITGCWWAEADLCIACKEPERKVNGPLRDRRKRAWLKPDECPHRTVTAIAEGYGGYGCHDCGAWFDEAPTQ